jgi:hypothetical protein
MAPATVPMNPPTRREMAVKTEKFAATLRAASASAGVEIEFALEANRDVMILISRSSVGGWS